MTYLTIRTEGALPARRVDFAQFAELFAEAEPVPPVRPRRGMLHFAAMPLLLAALAGNLVLVARPAALAATAGAAMARAAMAPAAGAAMTRAAGVAMPTRF